MPCKERLVAGSVEEALSTLACLRRTGRIIAGGTSLLAHLEQPDAPRVECLVDVTRIPGLTDIRIMDSFIVLGAAVTFARLAADGEIARHAPALSQAAATLGTPEVRARATLGGNVVNARSSANGALALLALRAEAEIANITGRQWVPVAQLFVAPGMSRIDPHSEIITSFRFPLRGPHESSAFEQVTTLPAQSDPSLKVAASVLLDAEAERFRDVRIALSNVAPCPCRLANVERALCGKPAEDEAIAATAEAVLCAVQPPPAWQPSREELVAALRRALVAAVARARRP